MKIASFNRDCGAAGAAAIAAGAAAIAAGVAAIAAASDQYFLYLEMPVFIWNSTLAL